MLTPIVTALVFGNCLACAWPFHTRRSSVRCSHCREKNHRRSLTPCAFRVFGESNIANEAVTHALLCERSKYGV